MPMPKAMAVIDLPVNYPSRYLFLQGALDVFMSPVIYPSAEQFFALRQALHNIHQLTRLVN